MGAIVKTSRMSFLCLHLVGILAIAPTTSHAQVSDGQPVNAATTNGAFLYKNSNDTAVNQLSLNNGVAASGPSITNIQREFNSLSSFTGKPTNQVYNYLPVWTNNDVGLSTDNVKVRADDLTAKFNSSTGHAHTGAAGDAPQINYSSIAGSIIDAYVSATAAIARSKLASGSVNQVVINNGSGVLSSEAQLAGSRGGTGASNSGSLTYGSNNITFTTTGTTGVTLPTSGTLATLTDITGAAYTSQQVQNNVGLAVSVAANAMTIALKQSDGSTNPSSGAGTVTIAFRDVTAATGAYSLVGQTSALSIVLPSGASLGQANAIAQYVWVYALNDGGTLDLCASGDWGPDFDDTSPHAVTQISAGATSKTVIYCTSAHTGSKAIRLIGQILVTEATAGTWATGASQVALYPIPKFNRTKLVSTGGITLTASGSAASIGASPSRNDISCWRNGAWVEGRLEFRQINAGSAGTGIYFITLPSGCGSTIDTTRMSASADTTANGGATALAISAGMSGGWYTDGSERGVVVARAYDTTHFTLLAATSTSFGQWGNSGFGALSKSAIGIGVDFRFPILGWSDYGP